MLSPIPLERFAASVRGTSSEFLPPEAYTSPSFYEFELGAIWRKEWLAVGRLEEIPNVGDYFSVTVGQEPITVVRASEGEIVALSPICRHRGMLVAEGSGNCRGAFVCRYHSWSYDLRGELRGAPQMAGREDFDRRRYSLPRLRVELWRGIIFINFDEQAGPLAPRLKKLDELVNDWHIEALQSEAVRDPSFKSMIDHAWNWKVYTEGQSECYHCDKLHASTPIMKALDFSTMSLDLDDPDGGTWAIGLRSRDIDPTINQFGKAILPPIATLSDEQRRINYAVNLAPNVFMALMADSVMLVSWMPLGPRSMRVKRHRLYPQSTLAMPDFVEIHGTERSAVREFVGQDEYALERVQIGLSSIFAPRGPVAPNEPILAAFNKWLVDRYQRADVQARAMNGSGAA